ncbi:Rab GDP dissociation inhibitor [Nematocida sp. AWRm80]|nr:Rab GDP dissociation inhibitor [Nematocida sp. AWRm80]
MTETPRAEECYDTIILGTGIKESILAGLLATENLKVLQIDHSSNYGSASKTLKYNEFVSEMQMKYPLDNQFVSSPELENQKIYIDLTPKIFLADEGVVTLIGKHNLSHCIDFCIINEQYLINHGKSLLIPNTKTSALTSGICGPMQLIRLNKFMNMIKKFYNAAPEEKQSILSEYKSVSDLYNKYGVSEYIREILGHGIALYTSEEYLKDPPQEFIMRLTTYFRSVARITVNTTSGNSPFLYPKYGISEISQGFSRLCAVKGGTTRMSTEITEMIQTENGYMLTLHTDGNQDSVFGKVIIANDQYHRSLSQSNIKEIHTIRGVFIMRNTSTHSTKQALIINSQSQSDIFLLILSHSEGVCPEGYSIGYITAEYYPERDTNTSETNLNTPDNTNIYHQIYPAIEQLVKWKYSIVQQFIWIDYSTQSTQIDPFIIPLAPMDNTVDFRTVYTEVQSILSRYNNT